MKINCKFAEYVLAPVNAISSENVETLDGVKCKAIFQTTWNNSDERYNDELEDVCQSRFGCSFQSIRSLWISRLGYVGDYWHLIKLIQI